MTPILIDLADTSLRLPAHPRLIRDTLVEAPGADHDLRYDYATLFYDCLWDPARGAVSLAAPPLLNLRALVEEAEWALDGRVVTLARIEPLTRGELLVFPAEHPPTRLSVRHPLFSAELPVDRPVTARFAGCNVLYAISKDNRLNWIADWLQYYQHEHRADAVVVIDNGSRDYDMDALAATLAQPGIKAAAILRADFPFGPSSSPKSKFLHMTMVHVIRARLIGQARAALNVDIDELVWSATGQSVFDATVENPDGYLRFNGRWVHAQSGSSHADHGFIRQGDARVPRKYCVVPDGPLAAHNWHTHRILSRRDPVTPEFGFWHCRQVSTGWDYAREVVDPAMLTEEPHLAAAMDRVFGADERMRLRP